MHELCEHLVKQAEKISAKRYQQNRELSVSELNANEEPRRKQRGIK